MISLLDRIILVVCRLFPLITISISCHSLLACRFLLKDQLLAFWGSCCVLFVAFPCCFGDTDILDIVGEGEGRMI